jgi:hypothetical protein
MQTIEDDIDISPDEIQAEIDKLNQKLKKIELESEEDVEKVRLPLGDAHIRMDKSASCWRRMITPPELLLLIAIHKHGAGGNPLIQLKLAKTVRDDIKKQAEKEMNPERKAWLLGIASESNIPDSIEVDPRGLKNALIVRYGQEKTEKLFPGSEPKLPETFRRVISRAGEVNVKSEGLFSMQAFAAGE